MSSQRCPARWGTHAQSAKSTLPCPADKWREDVNSEIVNYVRMDINCIRRDANYISRDANCVGIFMNIVFDNDNGSSNFQIVRMLRPRDLLQLLQN